MRRYWILAALVAVAAGSLLLLQRLQQSLPQVPTLSEESVREAIATTIQRESPAAFLVTGRLSLTVTTRVENSKVVLPGVVGLDLGTNRAVVRVPGRVYYGFEADSLRPEMVRLLDDGAVELRLPPLAVHSLEPDLSRLEVETTRGWARIGSDTHRMERRALTLVQRAMRRQALAHLRSSYQPRINAGRALERLLTPALRGLGMEDPEFRVRLGEDLVILPSG